MGGTAFTEEENKITFGCVSNFNFSPKSNTFLDYKFKKIFPTIETRADIVLSITADPITMTSFGSLFLIKEGIGMKRVGSIKMMSQKLDDNVFVCKTLLKTKNYNKTVEHTYVTR